MTEPSPFESLLAFLRAGELRQVREGTVARFEGHETIVDLDPEVGASRAVGRILANELSWRREVDPAQVIAVGQRIQAEVIGVDPRTRQVLLSARACEHHGLRTFLLSLQPGDVLTGTVTEIHDFGAFVHLDGEPVDNPSGMNGTGFLRVSELSWSHVEQVSDVVQVGQQVTTMVIECNTRRGQVAVSLKALQDDPFGRFTGHVGDVMLARITKIVSVGVFVRLAEGVEGLLRFSDPAGSSIEPGVHSARVGEEIMVKIVDLDSGLRRISLVSAG